MTTQVCRQCGITKPAHSAYFSPYNDGLRAVCRDCRNANKRAERVDVFPPTQAQTEAVIDAEVARLEADRARRLRSNHAPLKAEDFNAEREGKYDPHAGREKRQEFSGYMAEVHEAFRQHGANVAAWPAHVRQYAQEFLPEQERRMRNRRTARSISLTTANESLFLAQLRDFAGEYLRDKVTPAGYSTRIKPRTQKRTVVALWSDFHLGSELTEIDNPIPFGAIQEARRLEAVMCQVRDYKPQHREQSKLVLIIAGDMIEGKLHDLQDGAPLAEQCVIFWKLLAPAIGILAAAFPEVDVHFQVGNHGRNLLRHPGRATSSKWDSIEFALYQGLAMMLASLPNVRCHVPTRPWSIVPLHGHNLLVTHSDTEVKIGHPGKHAEANSRELSRINATNRYGVQFDAFAAGHWHWGMFLPGVVGRHVAQVFNGSLVPSRAQGYARTAGYDNSPCGQMLWEAVEGHPVGDVRFCGVDERTDADESLGKLIKPFRLT